MSKDCAPMAQFKIWREAPPYFKIQNSLFGVRYSFWFRLVQVRLELFKRAPWPPEAIYSKSVNDGLTFLFHFFSILGGGHMGIFFKGVIKSG
jgi:hypothetical protein